MNWIETNKDKKTDNLEMLNLSKNIRYCYLGNKSKAYIITSSVDNSKEILKSKIKKAFTRASEDFLNNSI